MSQHPTYDPADSVVRARGLCRRFTPDAGILDGVDLDLGAGEVVALVGRRGSVASGYLRLPERIALLGTSADAAPWKRTLEYVAAGVPGVATRRPARRALAEVGLLDAEASWAGDLSFLDQQRLALARVLAGEPELILADQPWQTLEPLGKLALHRALRHSAAERRTAVLMVTNDPDQVLEVADRVLVLEAGRIVEELPVPRHGHDARAAVRARVVERVGTPSLTETVPVEERVTRRVTA